VVAKNNIIKGPKVLKNLGQILKIDILDDNRLQQDVCLRSRLIIPCARSEETHLKIVLVMYRINAKLV
jgi:hypothetical protein